MKAAEIEVKALFDLSHSMAGEFLAKFVDGVVVILREAEQKRQLLFKFIVTHGRIRWWVIGDNGVSKAPS